MIPYSLPAPDIFSIDESYVEVRIVVPQTIIRREKGVTTVESKFVNPRIKKVSFDMPFDNSIEVDEEDYGIEEGDVDDALNRIEAIFTKDSGGVTE